MSEGEQKKPHEHVLLVGGRAKQAQVYPKRCCQRMCEGIAAQKRADELGVVGMPLMNLEELSEVARSHNLDGEGPMDALHERTPEENVECYDDVSGEELDIKGVRKARKEEIAYFQSMKVYEKVPISEAYEKTGKAPILTRWIDINKGDKKKPLYRSRLVAKEFNTGARPDLFAATPPTECLKLLLHKLTTRGKEYKLLYADVSRAYFYAKAMRPVYVRIPQEDLEPGEEGLCGKLLLSMYGTRDAAQNWHEEYAKTLRQAGLERGVANPCLFSSKSKDLSVMVHGDDFVAVGPDAAVKEIETALAQAYKIKTEVLGTGKGEQKEVRILNRVVQLLPEGVRLEADPRHAERVIRYMGVEQGKTSPVPGSKEETKRWSDAADPEGGQDGNVNPELEASEASTYRTVAATLNYLAADRPDIQFAVKEAARDMSAPRRSSWSLLKKLARYLRHRPRLVLKYDYHAEQARLTGYSDSDYAGCVKTRKSTSGGCIMAGGSLLKSWSKQQKVVALSSAEAETYALVATACEVLGLQACAKDLGIEMEGELFADASAALGIVARTGIGKVRHIRTQALWLQECRQGNRLRFTKIPGSENPADAGTKYMTEDLLGRHLTTMGVEWAGGRAETAPTLSSLERKAQANAQIDEKHESNSLRLAQPESGEAARTDTHRSAPSPAERRHAARTGPRQSEPSPTERQPGGTGPLEAAPEGPRGGGQARRDHAPDPEAPRREPRAAELNATTYNTHMYSNSRMSSTVIPSNVIECVNDSDIPSRLPVYMRSRNNATRYPPVTTNACFGRSRGSGSLDDCAKEGNVEE